ncbi:MAG TPA: hypothetical protein VI524_14990 [Anaerolineales bacterium]|nr:hypothetical protein [Anaerolineales bacterium]
MTLSLLVFPRLEGWIDRIRESRSYRIVISSTVGTWHTIGSPENRVMAP